MKTNNLQKKSILTSIVLLATAAYHGIRERIQYSSKNDPAKMQRMVGDHIFGGFRARNLSAIYVPAHTKQKGWMRELRRTDRSHKYKNRKNRIHV